LICREVAEEADAVTTFETAVRWKKDKQAELKARDNPALEVASPPEFGGPEQTWSPEELLVGSIESCLMSTLLYFVERFRLAMTAYSSTAKGTLDKTPQGLRFAGVDVRIEVIFEDDDSMQKAGSLRLKEKLEKYCPVSASVNCPVSIDLNMRKADSNA
jgi:organic hydroperoxide reductase OsmC/OhrA